MMKLRPDSSTLLCLVIFSFQLLILLPHEAGIVREYIKGGAMALGALILALLALRYGRSDWNGKSVPLVLWTFLALVLWLGLRACIGGDGYDAAYLWNRWFLSFAILFSVFLLWRSEWKASLIMAASILLLTQFVILYLIGELLFSWHSFAAKGRLSLSFSIPNVLACWTLIWAPFAAVGAWSAQRGWVRMLHLVAYLSGGWLITASQSRAGFGLFLLQMVILGALFFRTRLREVGKTPLKKLLPIGLAVVVLTVLGGREIAGRYLAGLEHREFPRVYLFQAAWDKITEGLLTLFFGDGLGCFVPWIYSIPTDRYDYWAHARADSYAHNLILDIWMEGGLIGAVLLVAFGLGLVTVGFKLLRKCGKSSSEADLLFIGAVCLSLLCVGLQSLISIAPRNASILFPFFSLAGILLAHGRKTEGMKKPKRWIHPAYALILPVLISAGMIWRNVVADIYLRKSLDPGKKEIAVEKSLLWNPHSVDAWAVRLEWSYENDRAEAADEAYGEMQALVPFYEDWSIHYAHYLLSRKKFDQALEVVNDYLKANPYRLEAHFEKMIIAYVKADRPLLDEAVEDVVYRLVELLRVRKSVNARAQKARLGDGREAIRIDIPGKQPVFLPLQTLAGFFFTGSYENSREIWEGLEENYEKFYTEVLQVGEPVRQLQVTTKLLEQ
jgi:O-antigen ligase